ncbi:MAG: hypothetical protein ACYC46_14275 [Acidobacteriaceae bacterium]
MKDTRWQHFVAMALIGDGVLAVLRPERDAEAWADGPAPWKSLMHGLQDRPNLTRLIGIAQIIGGVWWVLEHEKEAAREKAKLLEKA